MKCAHRGGVLYCISALGAAASSFAAPVETAFTYQGKPVKSGSLVNDTCTFLFWLWDDAELKPKELEGTDRVAAA